MYYQIDMYNSGQKFKMVQFFVVAFEVVATVFAQISKYYM